MPLMRHRCSGCRRIFTQTSERQVRCDACRDIPKLSKDGPGPMPLEAIFAKWLVSVIDPHLHQGQVDFVTLHKALLAAYPQLQQQVEAA